MKTFILILLLSFTYLQAENFVKINKKTNSMLKFNISEIERIEFANISDLYNMVLYSNGSIAGSYAIGNIDSVTVNDSGDFVVFTNGNYDTYKTADIDSVLFVKYTDNAYEEISFGSHTWMLKNLAVSIYRNGENIRHAQTDEEWNDANEKHEGAWRYYNNDATNGEIYGKLYNWYAVNDSRGLAPDGWHVASDEEWIHFEIAAGMYDGYAEGMDWRGRTAPKIAGNPDLWTKGMLKNDLYFGESGFMGLPAGYFDWKFYNVGRAAYWWTSTDYISDCAIYREIRFDREGINRDYQSYVAGLSVRCVRDNNQSDSLKVIMKDGSVNSILLVNIETLEFQSTADAPKNLVCTVQDNYFNLNWESVKEAKHYTLYHHRQGETYYEPIENFIQDTTCHIKLSSYYNGINYFVVTATNQVSESEPSNESGYSNEIQVEIFVSVAESEKSPNISIYPNPCIDYIQVTGIKSQTANFTILDLLGNILIDSKENSINISSLATGSYIIRIDTGGKTSIRKFIKE